MAFRISITHEAEKHFKALTARERRSLQAAIASRLVDQPTTLSLAIKLLRPNSLAQFELRAGDLRVLYNVQEDEVILLVIGRKVGNTLIVGGEEFHGHQDDSTKRTRSEPEKDAQ